MDDYYGSLTPEEQAVVRQAYAYLHDFVKPYGLTDEEETSLCHYVGQYVSLYPELQDRFIAGDFSAMDYPLLRVLNGLGSPR